jgi:putative ABC transport system ATP-binding protein
MAELIARDIRRRMQDGQREFELIIDNLSLRPGDCKAIVGPSGCGKTTAMELLALASQPDEAGELVVLDGGNVFDAANMLARREHGRLSTLRARYFGYVLQTSSLLPFLRVGENVEVSQRFSGRLDSQLIDNLLDALGLPGLRAARPEALSVGQKQRVAVARALAHRPSFLLADEPTAALDPELARTTLMLSKKVMSEFGGSMLIITHDLDLASELGFEIVGLQPSVQERTLTTRIDELNREA